MKNVANELRQIRREMGKSQKDLAALLGIPQTTWANYEVGKANPPQKVLKKLESLGYYIPMPTSIIISGDNNSQILGSGSKIVKQYTTIEKDDDLLDLIHNYATPKMLKELRDKLLKIKEASE